MLPTHRLWHSYCEHPKFKFSFQDNNEKIYLTLRAHPITNLPWILVTILAAVLPIVFGQLLDFFTTDFNQRLFVVVFWYALLLSYVFNKIFFWYFNLGIITSKRIIDIDVVNLLNSHSTATTIRKIEEVDKKISGIFSAFFNYGNIFIQTASEFPNIEFFNVPYPDKIVQIVHNLMNQQHEHKQSL